MVTMLSGGCLHVSSRIDPKTNLSELKKIYVLHLLVDGRGTDQLIARELRLRGYDASAGPRTEMPPKVDAVIVYDDQWTTDMSTYMISLDFQVRTPRTDRPLAVAFIRHLSLTLTGGNPRRLVDKVIDKLFIQKPSLPLLPYPSPTPDFFPKPTPDDGDTAGPATTKGD